MTLEEIIRKVKNNQALTREEEIWYLVNVLKYSEAEIKNLLHVPGSGPNTGKGGEHSQEK
jgi:hypothetical protein